MPGYSKQRGKKLVAPRVMIIRGAPGVGKTMIAMKAFSLHKAKKKALIPIDVLQHFDSRGPNKDKMKLGVFHAAILARSFVREGFDVFVDYIFDVDLNFFVEKLFRSHAERLSPCFVQVFFLDAPFETVKARNAGRRDPMPVALLKKLYEACSATKGSLAGEIVVDTASNRTSVKKAAKAILAEQHALHDVDKLCQIELCDSDSI